MLVTLVDKKSAFWSWTMTLEFLVLMLSVLARVNGQWGYDDTDSVASLQEGESCRLTTRDPGICRRLTACPVYYEGLKQKTIKYSFLVRCSFIDAEEVICCPLEDTPTATDRSTAGWGKLIATTAKTTTPSPTSTTMKPIIVGNKTLSGNEPFFDLSKILKTTTTKKPRENRLEPQGSSLVNNPRPIQESFNTGFKNPWIANVNIPVPFQNQERPGGMIQQNQVRFPTERTIWKSPQAVIVDPDVEVFNTIDNIRDSSSRLVQFPGQMVLSSLQPFATNSPSKTEPIIVEHNNVFEQFKFRPGSDDSNLEGNSGKVVGWSVPNTQIPERTTTPRITTTTTMTTERAVLTNWMIDALNEVSVSTQPTFTTIATSRSPVTAIPFTTPSTATTESPDLVKSRDNGADRPSLVACRSYSGTNPAGLTFHILDGIPVAPGEYPHIGGLIFPQGGGAEIDNRCGSSLISERYVLTAAHCVNDPLALPTFVRFGVVEWNSKDDNYPPVDVGIENITLHPEYRSHLRYHDIALIRLSNNVEFSTLVRPACLNSDLRDIDSDIPLVVIGWGVTNVQSRARSEILLMTNVTTVALQDCNATHIAYGTSRAYRTGLNEGHYCAFDPELKKDACQADSGGPLQLVQNKQSTLVGIVSFGLSCGSAVPSVYVRVAYYLDWIESIVWPS